MQTELGVGQDGTEVGGRGQEAGVGARDGRCRARGERPTSSHNRLSSTAAARGSGCPGRLGLLLLLLLLLLDL